jgi:hypothetical protein
MTLELNLRTLGIVLVILLLALSVFLGLRALATNRSLAHQLNLERQKREEYTLLVQRLQEEKEALKLDDFYMVIDRAGGRFWIRKRDKLIKEGPCATGRGERWFRDVYGLMKRWDFDTPTGERKILLVESNPRWNRPDWYWLERGKKPPKPDEVIHIPSDLPPGQAMAYYRSLSKEEREKVRSEPGHLGAWKLGLGDGIYIHSGNITGGQVSHGCIRVLSPDLTIIHELIKTGSSVFIY